MVEQKLANTVEQLCINCSVMFNSVMPRTAACQLPPSIGFPRQEYWSGWPFPSPGYLPNPGTESGCPALQADSLLSEPPGKPCKASISQLKKKNVSLTVSFRKYVSPWWDEYQFIKKKHLSKGSSSLMSNSYWLVTCNSLLG